MSLSINQIDSDLERDENQKLANKINAFWAAQGLEAGAVVVAAPIEGKRVTSRKFFTIKSRMVDGKPLPNLVG